MRADWDVNWKLWDTNWHTAGVGVLYQFTKDATANLRQKDDAYGEALAGFMGGTVVGVQSEYLVPLQDPLLTALGGSIPMVLGAGAGFGVAMAAFRFTEGLRGYNQKEDDEDEVARKEEMRKMRRRPIQETLEQLGEGRGTFFCIQHIMLAADIDRHLRARLRRAEARAVTGQVRHRREGGARAVPKQERGPHGKLLRCGQLYIYSIECATKAYFPLSCRCLVVST